ncbi:CLUMA_CG017586, isoform A [Clunio marinus]|uniref:CLUMA_CG017586, isoform A n=1 Tax=Clunio marinus TaxID=568069 RepID=A0A1J1IXR2_9DIPT|nr:CLUMA_CG017586, isoform A [Clunio marinus]
MKLSSSFLQTFSAFYCKVFPGNYFCMFVTLLLIIRNLVLHLIQNYLCNDTLLSNLGMTFLNSRGESYKVHLMKNMVLHNQTMMFRQILL